METLLEILFCFDSKQPFCIILIKYFFELHRIRFYFLLKQLWLKTMDFVNVEPETFFSSSKFSIQDTAIIRYFSDFAKNILAYAIWNGGLQWNLWKKIWKHVDLNNHFQMMHLMSLTWCYIDLLVYKSQKFQIEFEVLAHLETNHLEAWLFYSS